MKRLAIVAAAAVAGLCVEVGRGQAFTEEGHFARVLVCSNEDARMELYLPAKVVFADDWPKALSKPVTGYYALDLSRLGKGKPLEPVKVSLAKDGKSIVVDQYTRGLPPTTVPSEGGVVSFDDRFAENATCRALRDDGEEDGSEN